MSTADIVIEQNGGEYYGNCWVSSDADFTVSKTDHKHIELRLKDGTIIDLEFDECIEI